MTRDNPVRPPLLGGIRGIIYVILGCFFVALGLLGAMLPVLPTTPFLLLASYFFVRSSPRLNAWLLRSPLFGPFLRDWHHHRGVRLHVKVTAIIVMALVASASIIWGNLPLPVLVLLLVLVAIGLVVVLRLPLVRDQSVTNKEEACVIGNASEAWVARPESSKGVESSTPFADAGRATLSEAPRAS
jgi:uncharacterized protein